VTAETLRLHRGLAVEKHRRMLQELGRQLSVSSSRIPPPTRCCDGSKSPSLPRACGLHRKTLREGTLSPVLSLLANDLAEASRDDMTRTCFGNIRTGRV
jgi:hypothetical protein